MGLNIKTIFDMYDDNNEIDMSEICKVISERTGVDYSTVEKVLDAEEEYLVEQNIVIKNK